LYVKNFPKANFSEEDLKVLFEPFGEILSCKVVLELDEAAGESGETKAPSGFGFVSFKNSEDAEKALEAFTTGGDDKDKDQTDFKQLFVCKAMKKADRQKQVKNRTTRFKRMLAR